MAKAKLLLTVVFVLALGAGVAAGMLVPRLRGARAAERRAATPLAAELGLTAEQNERMREIWEGVRDKVDASFSRAQDAQRRRDGEVVALMTEEQRAKFAAAQREYAATLAAIKAERDAAFQAAVARTETLLSPAQRERYRQMLQSRVGTATDDIPPERTPSAATTGPAAPASLPAGSR